jgi:hypothetical protein
MVSGEKQEHSGMSHAFNQQHLYKSVDHRALCWLGFCLLCKGPVL